MRDNRIALLAALLGAAGALVGALVGLSINLAAWVQWVLLVVMILSGCSMAWVGFVLLDGSPWVERRRAAKVKAAEKAAKLVAKRKTAEAKAAALVAFEADYLSWARFSGEASWFLEELRSLRDVPFDPTPSVVAEWSRRLELARYFARGINPPLRSAAHKLIADVEVALSSASDTGERESVHWRLYDWLALYGRHYGPWMSHVGWQRPEPNSPTQ